MAALAVGVVGQAIEEGDPLEFRDVFVPKGEIVGLRLCINEQLDRTEAVRPVPQDGRGDEGPAQGLADQVGSDFPQTEGALGEIPQRTLSALGFVDGQALQGGIANGGQESVVGTPWQEAQHLHLALRQEGDDSIHCNGFA
jgi:hypothetical protein